MPSNCALFFRHLRRGGRSGLGLRIGFLGHLRETALGVVVGLNSEKESRWTLEETRGQARDMTELEILVAEAVAAAVADFDRVGVSRRGT